MNDRYLPRTRMIMTGFLNVADLLCDDHTSDWSRWRCDSVCLYYRRWVSTLHDLLWPRTIKQSLYYQGGYVADSSSWCLCSVYISEWSLDFWLDRQCVWSLRTLDYWRLNIMSPIQSGALLYWRCEHRWQLNQHDVIAHLNCVFLHTIISVCFPIYMNWFSVF